MRIERKVWLVLPGLLLVCCAEGQAQTLAQPSYELFALWQSLAPSARQLPATQTFDGVCAHPLFFSPSANSDQPYIPPPPNMPILEDTPSYLRTNSAALELDPWELPDRKPRKVGQKHQGLLGSLDTQVEVTDAPVSRIWDDPAWKRTWQTNENWQMGLAGPLTVFGQVGANSDEAGQTNMKVSGRTGLSCKLPVGSLAELTLRSGPGVSYSDPLHPLHTQGRSDWLVEVQARWPLLFGIGLEYQGSAMPALTPLQQDMVNQDLRLAFPLGAGGKLKVGAKQQWAGLFDQRTPTTVLDNMQLYLGLELSR
jgi:hypothetical protein